MHWSAERPAGLREDIARRYRTPGPESRQIAGLACFHDEQVNAHPDGGPRQWPRPRPASPFG